MGKGLFFALSFCFSIALFMFACVSDPDVRPTDASSDNSMQPMDAGVDNMMMMMMDNYVPPDTFVPCGALGQSCCMQQPLCMGNNSCCSSKCVDMAMDPKNCGSCGNDCMGAPCMGGKCAWTILGTTGAKDPTALVVDNTYAYFGAINMNNGGLYRCAIGGCADGGAVPVVSNLAYAGDVAQTNTNVYVNDNNNSYIHIWSKQGMTDTPKSMSNPIALDVDLSYAYFISSSGPLQTAHDLSSPLQIGPSFQGASDIAASGNGYVFWTGVGINNRFVRGAPINTMGMQQDLATFAQSTELGPIAANGSSVVFTLRPNTNQPQSDVLMCSTGLNCNGGNNPTKLAGGQLLNPANRSGTITLDGTNVWWTAHDNMGHGLVMRCSASNGCNMNPTQVVQVPIGMNPSPGGIAVDSNYVYFLMGDNSGTKLYRALKN